MSHLCHVDGCSRAVPPERLMCGMHWRMVPRDLQRAVWKHYRPGQCDDKAPSREWLKAARQAINAVLGRPLDTPILSDRATNPTGAHDEQ